MISERVRELMWSAVVPLYEGCEHAYEVVEDISEDADITESLSAKLEKNIE